jgi:hypothetical protein
LACTTSCRSADELGRGSSPPNFDEPEIVKDCSEDRGLATDQFYGDRTYRARDPEGHVWTFGQTVRHVSREEAEKESGLKIEGWH